MAESQDLDISRLARAAGVPVRTVRFYISSRLLPSPEGRGRGAAYREEHLDRLRLIRTLVEQRVPLAEIRDTVAPLSGAEVRKLLERERRRATNEFAASHSSPKEYVSVLLDRTRRPSSATRSVSYQRDASFALPPAELPKTRRPDSSWRRIELAPGLELQVRKGHEKEYRVLVRSIIHIAEVETKDTELTEA